MGCSRPHGGWREYKARARGQGIIRRGGSHAGTPWGPPNATTTNQVNKGTGGFQEVLITEDLLELL